MHKALCVPGSSRYTVNLIRLAKPVAMSPPDHQPLLTSARELLRAAQAGALQPLLRGKKLGLVCEAEENPAALLFRRAAEALGAHVARLPVSLSVQSSAQEVQHTARMLGRLYDAIECQDMDGALVTRVRQEAGVPVFEALAGATHPSASWADGIEHPGSAADKRICLLQALLISELA